MAPTRAGDRDRITPKIAVSQACLMPPTASASTQQTHDGGADLGEADEAAIGRLVGGPSMSGL